MFLATDSWDTSHRLGMIVYRNVCYSLRQTKYLKLTLEKLARYHIISLEVNCR